MASSIAMDYKKEANRYRYYYQRLHIFYQKPVTKVSSAVIFTFATIIFFAIFAIRPTLQTIGELLKKIEDQQIVLDDAKKKTSALATAQQQLDFVNPHLSSLELAIPVDYKAQQIMLDLEATAGKLEIPLSSIRISDLEYPVSEKNANTIQEVTFTIQLNSTYPLIKQYAQEILQLPRLIAVENISISKSEKSTQIGSNPDILSGTIKCKAFYLKKSGGIK